MNTTAKRLANHYPKSLPYSPATGLQAEIGRLRRWNMFLLVMTGSILLAAVTTVVYFQNRPGRLLSEEQIKEAPALEPAAPAVLKTAALSSNPKDAAPLAKNSANQAKEREKFLEALGSLSAVHLYQTYLNIGLVADAVEKETYSKTEATKILQSVGELMSTVEKQLCRLPHINLDKDDQKSLDRIRAVTGQLRSQASALVSFWASADMQTVARYHQARERSWEDLKGLLGIDE